jgi:hypothetical protein
MRYNLESTLPINAFSPRGGRGPFSRGMTLEGGGGGILKPVTKAIGSVVKGATDVVKGVVQPVYNATIRNIPGVDSALVNLDKSVGKAIPGGWGTVAAVASSFIPGAQLAAMGMTKTGLATGLGALSGSGVMKKGNEFNLQGALMGGATAYGLSTLGEYARAAANPSAVTPTVSASGALSNSGGSALTGTSSGYVPSDFLSGTSIGADAVRSGASSLTPTANALAGSGDFIAPSLASSGTSAIPSAFGSINPGAASDFGLSASLPAVGAGTSGAGLGGFTAAPSFLDRVGTAISEVPDDIGNFLDKATTSSTYEGLGSKSLDTLKGMGSEMADTGTGIKNLLTNAPGASASAAATGISPLTSAGAAIMGGTGLMALEEQKAYLNEQLAAGKIAQDEYNAQLAEIDRQVEVARKATADNPFSYTPDRSVGDIGSTIYDKTGATDTLYAQDRNQSQTLYARGGSIDDNIGMDEYMGIPQGNMQKGFMGSGIAGYAAGGYADGGSPRFLSGGGDGMSDSIRASINGTQEARLADGEFVIPADVVSHLGNGSSKAGAKQLYAMMDKVRKARTGNPKQGKKINPRKYLAA